MRLIYEFSRQTCLRPWLAKLNLGFGMSAFPWPNLTILPAHILRNRCLVSFSRDKIISVALLSWLCSICFLGWDFLGSSVVSPSWASTDLKSSQARIIPNSYHPILLSEAFGTIRILCFDKPELWLLLKIPDILVVVFLSPEIGLSGSLTCWKPPSCFYLGFSPYLPGKDYPRVCQMKTYNLQKSKG